VLIVLNDEHTLFGTVGQVNDSAKVIGTVTRQYADGKARIFRVQRKPNMLYKHTWQKNIHF